MSSFTQQQQQQRTFEAANASDASIVKPTLPRNVLEEFQEFVHSGRRGSDLQPAAFEPPVSQQQPVTTKPAIPARPALSASTVQVDTKLQQMLGGIRAILVKNKQAMTLSELSNQIKQFSGQSWGGHWEHEYGNLTLFLKSHPEHFSVVKNKYVVVAGQEHLAQRQLEADLQAAAAAAAAPPAYKTATPPPQYYDDPFGVVQPPQQSYYQESSFYQDQPSFYQETPPAQTYYQEPPSYYQAAAAAPPQWWEQQQQQDAYYYQQQQQRDRELQLQREREQQQREREQQERREREEQLEIQRQLQREKEQWEADEEMARKLQQEEFARGGNRQPARAPSSSRETVVFTTSQMRDLAEREIGIDNVRIIAGFSVKKFGREGRPHQRKIWVTQSLTHVAWQSSLMEGNHRGIELKYVTQVASGQMTPTIARATGDSARVRALCFSLITQARTLDMEACSVIQRDTLVNALRAVVEFNHKYKPEKLDRDRTRILLVDNARFF